jgi:hypothetical protein
LISSSGGALAPRLVEEPGRRLVEVPALSLVEVPALSLVEVPALSLVEVFTSDLLRGKHVAQAVTQQIETKNDDHDG